MQPNNIFNKLSRDFPETAHEHNHRFPGNRGAPLIKQLAVFPIACGFEFVFGDETQSRGVNAIPQAGRRRAVLKNMPEMGIGLTAADLGAYAKQGAVFPLDNVGGFKRFCETWPAGPGFELMNGSK